MSPAPRLTELLPIYEDAVTVLRRLLEEVEWNGSIPYLAYGDQITKSGPRPVPFFSVSKRQQHD